MELSFCELRSKQVVNLFDGKNLGNVIDLTFDVNTTKVTGIIVPCDKSFFNIFKSNNDIFIPFHKICKIGKDIILVELTPVNNLNNNKQNTNKNNNINSYNNNIQNQNLINENYNDNLYTNYENNYEYNNFRNKRKNNKTDFNDNYNNFVN